MTDQCAAYPCQPEDLVTRRGPRTLNGAELLATMLPQHLRKQTYRLPTGLLRHRPMWHFRATKEQVELIVRLRVGLASHPRLPEAMNGADKAGPVQRRAAAVCCRRSDFAVCFIFSSAQAASAAVVAFANLARRTTARQMQGDLFPLQISFRPASTYGRHHVFSSYQWPASFR
jgi:hypothetical protein